MGDPEEGILLIATTMTALVAFTLVLLAVMVIYRKRKIQHLNEITQLQEKFEQERLQTHLEVKNQTMEYIGSEIHDNVNQKLSIAKMLTEQIAPGDDLSRRKIHHLAATIDQSLADLRNLSASLDSSGFHKADLIQLFQQECNRIRVASVQVEFSTNVRSIYYSDSVKLFAFRICQEFLQNVIKHSGCNLLSLSILQNETGTVEIAIADNGRGFDLAALDTHPGNGLRNMKKRAKFIGAQLQLESQVGMGTKMKLVIPS